ncbi:A24 family peptidase [Sphingobium agri]|uniref:Prepilin peptidase n=1 Tax=Sphingobium agri TaxID=2933566 RepID=A0ABT0E2P0_9SPHN|nr:prepilin peptidase [Sphingobium agri]MCK0533519.1 prepilin peptidase [Sphingobium agri]
MTGEYFKLALLCALGVLLVIACVTDWRSRIISNRLNLAIAALAPLWWITNGLPVWPGMLLQVALGLAVFALFAALFAMGCMGGGDVKLLGALALWFPWEAVLAMLMMMAMAGGVVTIVTVVHHRMTRRLGQPQIPYGIAISFAALWLIGERYLNHFA